MRKIPYLSFDEDGDPFRFHYRKKPVPEVSQIIKETGLSDFWNSKSAKRALLRGRNIHLAAKYYDEGIFDPGGLQSSLRGFLEGYSKFRNEVNFVFTEIEQTVYHIDYEYAGILDRFGFYENRPAIVEIKHGGHYRSYDLQHGGYCLIKEGIDNLGLRSFIVYLKENGTYSFEERTKYMPIAKNVFLAGLTVWKWRNGGKNA